MSVLTFEVTEKEHQVVDVDVCAALPEGGKVIACTLHLTPTEAISLAAQIIKELKLDVDIIPPHEYG